MMSKPEEHTDLTPRSAGRRMVTKIPTIHPGATIAEVENLLLQKTNDLETINYIYVTDAQNKLIGVISVKEVFRLPKQKRIAEVMEKDLVTVRPHTDQTRVALLAIEHRLKEIPVVDTDNHLSGVVPYDVILNTLQEQHIEDVLDAAGIHKFKEPAQTIINAPASTLLKKRLPWLLIGLGGSALAAAIIGYFKDALESQLLLAAFIPAVTYISDAVGTQSETIFVRSAALDKNFSILRYLKRELLVGVGLAAFLAIAIALISYLLWQTYLISLTLGVTFLVSILISMAVAILLPWLFAKAHVDPAIVGGPLDTIVSDITSIVVYFSVATLLLNALT